MTDDLKAMVRSGLERGLSMEQSEFSGRNRTEDSIAAEWAGYFEALNRLAPEPESASPDDLVDPETYNLADLDAESAPRSGELAAQREAALEARIAGLENREDEQNEELERLRDALHEQREGEKRDRIAHAARIAELQGQLRATQDLLATDRAEVERLRTHAADEAVMAQNARAQTKELRAEVERLRKDLQAQPEWDRLHRIEEAVQTFLRAGPSLQTINALRAALEPTRDDDGSWAFTSERTP